MKERNVDNVKEVHRLNDIGFGGVLSIVFAIVIVSTLTLTRSCSCPDDASSVPVKTKYYLEDSHQVITTYTLPNGERVYTCDGNMYFLPKE